MLMNHSLSLDRPHSTVAFHSCRGIERLNEAARLYRDSGGSGRRRRREKRKRQDKEKRSEDRQRERE